MIKVMALLSSGSCQIVGIQQNEYEKQSNEKIVIRRFQHLTFVLFPPFLSFVLLKTSHNHVELGTGDSLSPTCAKHFFQFLTHRIIESVLNSFFSK